MLLNGPVHKKILLLLLASALLFDFTSCSSMSPQARRERAYRHYVSKQMKMRQKQIARDQKAANREMKRKMKSIQPSEQQVTTRVETAPSDYPSVFDPNTTPSTSVSEPVAPPITVSLTSPSASQNGNEPAQP